jgi:hypothetical protein
MHPILSYRDEGLDLFNQTSLMDFLNDYIFSLSTTTRTRNCILQLILYMCPCQNAPKTEANS